MIAGVSGILSAVMTPLHSLGNPGPLTVHSLLLDWSGQTTYVGCRALIGHLLPWLAELHEAHRPILRSSQAWLCAWALGPLALSLAWAFALACDIDQGHNDAPMLKHLPSSPVSAIQRVAPEWEHLGVMGPVIRAAVTLSCWYHSTTDAPRPRVDAHQ